MQLTFAMMGGLGLLVSVVNVMPSDNDPSRLEVNPETDILYSVADSEIVMMMLEKYLVPKIILKLYQSWPPYLNTLWSFPGKNSFKI